MVFNFMKLFVFSDIFSCLLINLWICLSSGKSKGSRNSEMYSSSEFCNPECSVENQKLIFICHKITVFGCQLEKNFLKMLLTSTISRSDVSSSAWFLLSMIMNLIKLMKMARILPSFSSMNML